MATYTVLVENFTLLRLARNPQAVQLFPELQPLLLPQGGGCCARPDGRYENLKMALSGLPDARKQQFKDLLGAPNIKMYYTQGGKLRETTF